MDRLLVLWGAVLIACGGWGRDRWWGCWIKAGSAGKDVYFGLFVGYLRGAV